jgi:electron transfer flavoprotein beta subunit
VRILVFVKSVCDVKVPIAYEESTGRPRSEKNLLMLNPADAAAVAHAVRLKEFVPAAYVTVAHLGPPSAETILRQCLSVGCDEAIRVWDDELSHVSTRTKSIVLSRAARVLSFDLLFTGARSQDTGNGQLGILVASMLDVPCVTYVTFVESRGKDFVLSKQLSDGSLERMESPGPVVVTVESGEGRLGPPSLGTLLDSSEWTIRSLDLADLGVPPESIREAESLLAFGPLRPPGARLNYIPAPDSSLPAFDRRMRLMEGAAKKRQATVVTGDEDEIVEELFQSLLDEGWLEGAPVRA